MARKTARAVGRPAIDRGAYTSLHVTAVTLAPSHKLTLSKIGAGSVSAGVRLLTDRFGPAMLGRGVAGRSRKAVSAAKRAKK